VSELPKKDQATVDLSPVDQARSLCEAFEAAWRDALQGAEPPRLETYLAAVPDINKGELRSTLEPIERDYQQRLAARKDTGVWSGREAISAPESPAASPPTLDHPSGEQSGPATKQRSGPPGKLEPTVLPGLTLAGSQDVSFTFGGGAKPASPEPPAAPPGYEILGVLGRGGMGVVYQARQKSLNRLVALKMLLAGAHAGPEQLIRFYTEAEAVAALQHPNIVQIYEVGDQGGLPYFSLEFVDGGSLEKKLAGKPLPAREAAQLIEVLARAMHYAHQNGVVHRDLKPANILLASSVSGYSSLAVDQGQMTNDKGQVTIPKITDFGLAKRLDTDVQLTQSGVIAGTPGYLAPEQASGAVKQIGPATDIYALGAILYELLTGRPPFTGAAVMNVIVRTLHDDPVVPRLLEPRVPRDLETICLKCLQKEPARRYADAAALAEDLHRFLAGEPILARPVGTPERLWRWCRRNPRTVALGAVVILLLATLGVFAAVAAVRASRDREAIADARKLARLRLQNAAEAIARGDPRRAQDLLGAADPVVESAPALADVRGERATLQAQVAVYMEFKKSVDAARYAGLFGEGGTSPEGRPATPRDGQRQELEAARRKCQLALQLYDDIERRAGKAAQGLPPLEPAQERLLREDAVDAFLMAALVEWKLSLTADNASARREAVRQAIAWLDRAEKSLPPSRILYDQRRDYYKLLDEPDAAQADAKRAEAIAARSAVDHFWQGVAEMLLGETAHHQGDARQAQQHYRKAMTELAALLQLRPDHFWGYFEWAFCHFRLGNLHDALVGFTACTHLKPDAPWPYYNRGTVHYQLKQYDQASADFDAAVERDPGYARAYFNRSLCWSAKAQTDRALEDLGRAIAANADYALAYFQRAQIYRQLQRHREARDDLSAVLRLQPGRADCYLQRGFTNLLLKDFDAALDDCRQAARLQATHPMPHYLIGIIHLGRRHYDLALLPLEKALSLQADFDRPRLARAQLYLRQGKLTEALADVDYVLQRLPPAKRHKVLNDRADVYRAMGRLHDAVADYERSLELEPKQLEAYVGLALVCGKQNQPDLARACYERLVKANPDSAPAYLRRAEFRRNQQQFAEALADCDEAARRDKDSVLPGLVRASIEAARGDHARAVAEAERLLPKGPPGDGHMLYAATCVWSLASQAAAAQSDGKELARQYADRAADLLTQTLDKGFHDLLYEEHNRMPDDPALAALRQHPRWRELFGDRP
jgi:serine/threonine protein kinase/tetratricopeptide (TPR) repeat protein